MPHATSRSKAKSRAIEPYQPSPSAQAGLPPHLPLAPVTGMPHSPPKTSPSPPGLRPFPGEEEPNDVFSQAGPSSRPMQPAVPGVRGPPIDVDAEVAETSSTPMEVDLVIQCKVCKSIVGDSSAYVAARKDLGLLVLSSVAQHIVLSNPPSTNQDPDLNSLYMPLDITCGCCESPLGKVYRMTAVGLDELRDGYSFERDRISVYQLGTGVRSPLLAPLLPSPQVTVESQHWRPPLPPSGSSEGIYSPHQHHRDRSPPPPDRSLGGIPPTPHSPFPPYPNHPMTTPGGPGAHGMYSRPPSLGPIRRTPSIAGPLSLRGSVGPMSMRGSMTPGPGAGTASVATLKQKAIMIEMGDRIKSLEGGIGSMDERVRTMLDERMGPVEGLLREILRGQASLVGGGTGNGNGNGNDQREALSPAATTTTPQRPPPRGLNGSAANFQGEGHRVTTAVETPKNNGGGGGGMPPPKSVPKSANRIPKSILSSLSGTPLRKRIVDGRKGSTTASSNGSPNSILPSSNRGQQQQQAVQQNLKSTTTGVNSPTGSGSHSGGVSPRLMTLGSGDKVSNSPQRPTTVPAHKVPSHSHSPSSLSNLTSTNLLNTTTSPSSTLKSGMVSHSFPPLPLPLPSSSSSSSLPPPSTSTSSSSAPTTSIQVQQQRRAQYEHDELDGLDHSFDGLDGDLEVDLDEGEGEGEGGGDEGERREEVEKELMDSTGNTLGRGMLTATTTTGGAGGGGRTGRKRKAL